MATAMIQRYCPQGGAVASGMYYTRTGEEELQCSMCGYDFRTELIVSEKGASEEAPFRRVHERTGLGAYFIQYKNAAGKMAAQEKELTEDDIRKFLGMLEAPNVDRSGSWLTKWNDVTKKIEVVFGTPAPITELLGRQTCSAVFLQKM